MKSFSKFTANSHWDLKKNCCIISAVHKERNLAQEEKNEKIQKSRGKPGAGNLL